MNSFATQCAVALTLTLCLYGHSARGDQTDPRLPELFAQLASSEDVARSQAIEREIWGIWLTTNRAEIAALLDEGVRAMGGGDIAVAIERFDKIIEQAPDFAEGWNKRATALYLKQDYAGSMRDIERTLALEPRHFGAISGMGLILMATGDRYGAMNAFEQVLKINPTSISARHHLRELGKRIGASGA